MKMDSRRFLFLQGLATPFFRELAADLRHSGASVHRVNFRMGDKFWWRGPAINYRSGLEKLPEFPAWAGMAGFMT
jgi:capsular polysaccharide export protein